MNCPLIARRLNKTYQFWEIFSNGVLVARAGRISGRNRKGYHISWEWDGEGMQTLVTRENRDAQDARVEQLIALIEVNVKLPEHQLD